MKNKINNYRHSKLELVLHNDNQKIIKKDRLKGKKNRVPDF